MSTNGVYSHKTLQPTERAPASGSSSRPTGLSRLNDSLDAVKQEFEALTSEMDGLRSQRDEYEAKMVSQVNELNIIRQSLYDLEAQHNKVRKQYEEELNRLRSDLATARQTRPPGIAGLGIHSPREPPIATSSALPDPQTTRERSQSQSHLANERWRELHDPQGERESREKFKILSESDRDRELDRLAEQRDSKRLKSRRERSDQYSPALTPKTAPRAPSMSSQGGPSQTASTSSIGPLPPMSMGPKGGYVEDLTLQNVPPECRKEGSDWFAVFNPRVPKRLDINLVHTLVHASVVCCVQFSPDGKFLATGCNRTAQIYDTKTGAKTCVLVDDSAGLSGDLYIRSVRFSPDGRFLATGAEDRQIRIWDIANKKILHVFEGHQQEIYSLDFSRDGRLIISGSGDKTMRIWNMTDNSCKVFTINDADSLNDDAGVTSVAISPNGAIVAAGSLDTVVRLWDVSTGKLLERLRGHKDSVYSVAFTPDGKGLVTGSLDKTLKYWDISGVVSASGKGKELINGGSVSGSSSAVGNPSSCTMNFIGHKDYVLSVAMSNDGKWVVSGSKDRCVHFWDSADSTLQFLLQGHKNSVISLDLNSSGNLLATGSGDSLARIWSYGRA